IAIACTNNRMFARLCQAMGRGELATDLRMQTTPARLAHRAAVNDVVAQWVGAQDAVDALAALDAAEVPAAPVNSVADLFRDPQVAARENIVRVASAVAGMLAMPAVVPR